MHKDACSIYDYNIVFDAQQYDTITARMTTKEALSLDF